MTASGRDFSRRLAAGIALVVLTAVAYRGLAAADFVSFDDAPYVTDNPVVAKGLSASAVRWAFTTTTEANWHPLTWLSHLLDVELFGLNPRGHHLMNLALHEANTLLLFAVLAAMTGAFWRSAFVAALFAIHPLHVESVAWVAERKDLLSSFFWMAALGAYLRYVRRPSTARYLPVLLALGLGLLAKSMVVTLPLVLLLLDYWPLRRAAGPAPGGERHPAAFVRLVAEKIPLLALSAVAGVVTYEVQKAGGALGVIMSLPAWRRLVNAVVSYGWYAWKSLVPAKLAVYYSFTLAIPWWQVAASLLFMASVTAVVLRAHRRRGYLATGWGWFLVTLVPVIGIVQAGAQARADRYTYLPLLGLFIVLSWGAADLARSSRTRSLVIPALLALTLPALVALTGRQVSFWRDDLTLYGHALSVAPEHFLLRNNLGRALEVRGRPAEALGQYRRALELNPAYAETHNNIGALFAREGRREEALPFLLRALELKPALFAARFNLALVLEKEGNFAEAFRHFQEALRLRPDHAAARAHLANLARGGQ